MMFNTYIGIFTSVNSQQFNDYSELINVITSFSFNNDTLYHPTNFCHEEVKI